MVKIAAAALLVASGCIQDGSLNNNGDSNTNEPTNVKARYVCIGMENSSRFGSCPGCELDATRIASLLRDKYNYEGVTMISGEAKKARVCQELKDAVSKTEEDELFIFCYSGHGGQERLGGTEPENADAPDEFLCLYDTYMLDDEIWGIVSKCKGRVFMYFDACHSATMYRSVSEDLKARAAGIEKTDDSPKMVKTCGFTFNVKASAMSASKRSPVRMMCWSGCKEAEYSYGSSSGGFLTRALMSSWRKDKTYKSLWKDVSSAVTAAEPTQHPICTEMGGGFDAEVFK